MAKATTNDHVVLDALLTQRQQERAPGMSQEDFFEVFVADEVLNAFRVSDSDVDFGLTGGGADGGIDAFYTFVDRELVMEVDDIPKSKDPTIDLVMVQATTSARFTEDRIGKFHDSLKDLLELDADPRALKRLYNPSVIGASRVFAATYLEFVSKFPTLRVRVIYASKGVVPPEKSRLRVKARAVEELVKDKFQDAEVDFQFLGARGLVDLAHRKPALDFSVDLENVMNVGPSAYVALVRLSEYHKIISDDQALRSDIFDANVRDYEGNVAVNRAIASSLETEGTVEDFWWLNNGMTILATKASMAGKKLSLRDPQIVNGFQTSTEIFNFFQGSPGSDDRTILARILVTESDDVRDEIIRATNSQTSVGVFALKATDPLHRLLETFLNQKSLYYERRKNYHKNRGRPRTRIVTLADTAQAMMATLLFRPDDSRARPSSLVKNDAAYTSVFNSEYPLEAYFKAITVVQKIWEYLTVKGLPAPVRNNFKFHMAMAISTNLGVKQQNAESLAALDLDAVDRDALEDAYALVEREFDSFIRSGNDQNQDRAAKSPKVRKNLADRLGAT